MKNSAWSDERPTGSEERKGLRADGEGRSPSTGWPGQPAPTFATGLRDNQGRWATEATDWDRWWAHVDVAGGPAACWLWTGRCTDDGYPLFDVVVDGRSRPVRAYRWAWEQRNGLLLPRWTLDHLCHTWSTDCPGGPACWHLPCVRFDHLEPLPPGGNQSRRHARDRALAAIQEASPR